MDACSISTNKNKKGEKMKEKKMKLNLKKHTVANLNSTDMSSINGGADTATWVAMECTGSDIPITICKTVSDCFSAWGHTCEVCITTDTLCDCPQQ